VTGRRGAWLAAAGSGAAFAAAVFLRMDAAYGPLKLSVHPEDWRLLWELWRDGQIPSSIVAQSVGLGAAAAAVPWVVRALVARRRAKG
jgi:hypothetical protein